MEETQVQKKDKKEFWRAVKFTLISISAGIVQTLSYTLCYEAFKLNHWIASAIGLVLSVIWNFTINRKVTFKSISNVTKAMLLVAAFYVVFGPLAIWLNYLAEGMANGYLLLLATMIVNLVLEYIYMRLVVYRNSCDTMPEKKNDNETKKAETDIQEKEEK